MATQSDLSIPSNYKEATCTPKSIAMWQKLMEDKWAMMKECKVFHLVPCPPDRNVVRSKWTYVHKFNEEGDITKHKAQLVAQGFTQIPGLNFDNTYASVVHLESIRMSATTAANLGLCIWQVDFVAAYLNADNDFEVYMEKAEGFIAPGEEDKVLFANKVIYGMMNEGYNWEKELSMSYTGLGYYQSKADPCVCSHIDENRYTLTNTYMDDVFGILSTPKGEQKSKDELAGCYELKDLGELKYIVGIQVQQDEKTGAISLSQHAYLERTLCQDPKNH